MTTNSSHSPQESTTLEPPGTDTSFRLGVVEGFFGKPWSWHARKSYANFLKDNHFNSYLYAPKADRSLRQEWDQPFHPHHQQNLEKIARLYRQEGIDFSIGLSPFELYRDFSKKEQQSLKSKLESINSINPSSLCLLFDDMVGSVHSLASSQVDIMHFVMEHSTASHFQFCPTYYSFDPILSEHFGSEPENYLKDLGDELDKEVGIFWTGPKVCSDDYPADHLQQITELFQRKPLIWDNYPVNDSKRLSDFLLLSPGQRSVPTLQQHTSGHMANPMNQAWLSQIPLKALALQYRQNNDNNEEESRGLSNSDIQEVFSSIAGQELSTLLLEDLPFFQTIGLSNISPEKRLALKHRYTPWSSTPFAQEVLDWLDGEYAFDPACLT